MKVYIFPLHKQHLSQVLSFLQSQEPWHMIPLDALLLYNMNYPNQRWFAEIQDGRMKGVIFQDKGLLHFAYPQAPEASSPVYSFIRANYSTFMTHGKKEILEPLLSTLQHRSPQSFEESIFVQQSPKTEPILCKHIGVPRGVTVRFAHPLELRDIHMLFQGSTVEREIDPDLMRELIYLQRILIAEKEGRLVGTIMKLKETIAYSLLGGLFVSEEFRQQGIARYLGKRMVLNEFNRKKNVCFFYKKEQVLQDFYRQGHFIPLGKWRTYSVSLAVKN